ncbi:hypothetical protein SpCBS45565_g07874 [Spizellomyces sp. 'palustris']|nr:hypothetical protein SpCBS45565_g07874 [Spizellomyces sp. 'palustris']
MDPNSRVRAEKAGRELQTVIGRVPGHLGKEDTSSTEEEVSIDPSVNITSVGKAIIPKVSHLRPAGIRHQTLPQLHSLLPPKRRTVAQRTKPVNVQQHFDHIVLHDDRKGQFMLTSGSAQQHPPSSYAIESKAIEGTQGISPSRVPSAAPMRTQSPSLPTTFGRAITGRLPGGLVGEREQGISSTSLDVMLVGHKVDPRFTPPTDEWAFEKYEDRPDSRSSHRGYTSESISEFEPVDTQIPVSLDPVVVGETPQNVVSTGEMEDTLPFTSIDEVDNVIKKYAAIIESRIRKLRRESVISESSTVALDSSELQTASEPGVPEMSAMSFETPIIILADSPEEATPRIAMRIPSVAPERTEPLPSFGSEESGMRTSPNAEKIRPVIEGAIPPPAHAIDRAIGEAKGDMQDSTMVELIEKEDGPASITQDHSENGQPPAAIKGPVTFVDDVGGGTEISQRESVITRPDSGDLGFASGMNSAIRDSMVVTSLQALIANQQRKRRRIDNAAPSVDVNHIGFPFAKFYAPVGRDTEVNTKLVNLIRGEVLEADALIQRNARYPVRQNHQASWSESQSREEREIPDIFSGEDATTLELQGRPVVIKKTAVGAGSMSIGMNWAPAPPTLSIPSRISRYIPRGGAPMRKDAPSSRIRKGEPRISYDDIALAGLLNRSRRMEVSTALPSPDIPITPLHSTENNFSDNLANELAASWVHPGALYTPGPFGQFADERSSAMEEAGSASSVPLSGPLSVNVDSNQPLPSALVPVQESGLNNTTRTPSPPPIRHVHEQHTLQRDTEELPSLSTIQLDLQLENDVESYLVAEGVVTSPLKVDNLLHVGPPLAQKEDDPTFKRSLKSIAVNMSAGEDLSDPKPPTEAREQTIGSSGPSLHAIPSSRVLTSSLGVSDGAVEKVEPQILPQTASSKQDTISSPSISFEETQMESNEDPATFYFRKRNASLGFGASGSRPASRTGATPTATRPASRTSEFKSSNDSSLNQLGIQPSTPMSSIPETADGLRVSVDDNSATEVTRASRRATPGISTDTATDVDLPASGLRTVAQALVSKGYTPDKCPPVYHIVHDVERRRQTMTSEERARYPTFTEPTLVDTLEISAPGKQEAEIEKLTAMISSSSLPVPAYLRRRGILYGQLGKYELALDDFNTALEYDPFNSEACWYRHQLNLMFGHIQAALQDLDTITETNKQHFGAFQAKARIYQELGMIKLAIVSYSQVIKLKPNNADGYFQRACLFEAENEAVYASEDFKMVRSLDPDNERAIRNLAFYSFQRELWNDAIQALSKLIHIAPDDSEAYQYRGRAYAYLGKWDESLQDMTLAIQTNPKQPESFFHRASLLRERHPWKAIEDYSICLLLDDGPLNTEACYQRALLYYKLGEYSYAIADLLAVLDLDPSKSQAYLKLGILYMRYMEDFLEALRCFNKCVAINPVQLQAYLCRGDLYQCVHEKMAHDDSALLPVARGRRRTINLGDEGLGIPDYRLDGIASSMQYINLAIKEYSKAIHLAPNNHLLYLYRGKILIRAGRMQEATNDFHAAFEINAEIAQTFVQRALVLSFQRKYTQIIIEFKERSKVENIEDPTLFMLVAKAKINCGDNEGALKDLGQALKYNKREPQIYLQRGICFENLQDWASAVKELTSCILLNPDFAKAYYHRGLSKLHLQDQEGVEDLGTAIKLDPKFFESYMTRASYHHLKGNYVNGVDDCNEALKIEPTSIRAYLLRGACNCKLHQFTLALNDFTRAVALDRTSHFAFYNRAVTYQLMGDDQSAIKDYSIAMLLHNDSNAYRNRGLLYWKQGDPANALLDLYAARDAFPEDPRLHGLLGLCLQTLGKVQESVEAFSAAIAVNPYMTEAYLGRGNVYALQGLTASARKDYLRVLHMYPRCSEALVNMAYTMQAENRPKRAYDLFSTALVLDPKCEEALEGRSVVHFALKNFFGALVDICKAIELSPCNCEYLTNRGVVYQALGDNVSALQNYKLAIKYNPSYALAHLNAANLYFYQKRWEQALEAYDATLQLSPSMVSAYVNRGITKAILKDTTGALSDFDHAADLNPSLPEVFFNRGHVMQTLDRHEDAERDYSRVLALCPLDSLAHTRRGDARGHQANISGAMHDYALAVAQNPD